jgi:SAM-dependent methyltransferase
MVRYVATAAALKFFSLAPARPVYRALGNSVGGRRRARVHAVGDPSGYLTRARRILDRARDYQLVGDGASIVEIGTGWLHWEATVLALFYDIEATLLDVWDNRQFTAYKAYLRQLQRLIDDGLDVEPARIRRARRLIERLFHADSFAEAYAVTNSRYTVDERGTLETLETGGFDFVVSVVVLEHVERGVLHEFMQNMSRALKPGGRAYHAIDIGDHLSNFDPTAHQKQYLSYSDRTWRLVFENRVQYFNRLQRSEWLALFESAGLRLTAVEDGFTSVDRLQIAPEFRRFSDDDLRCVTLQVVAEKPEPDEAGPSMAGSSKRPQ